MAKKTSLQRRLQRKRKKAREMDCAKRTPEFIEQMREEMKYYASLGNCTTIVASPPYQTVGFYDRVCSNQEKEKENTMAYEVNQDTAARHHLISRLDSEYFTKSADLRTKFHMNPLSPKNIKELREMLADGRATVSDSYNDDTDPFGWSSPTQYISFVDKERDEAGHKVAENLLSAAYTKAHDVIKVLPVEKGLEALNEFEAFQA